MTGTTTWRELISQPETWAGLIARLDSGALALPVSVADFDEFLLLGSGTSYYLALTVADWMRRRGINARAVPSCEVLLDPHESRPSALRRLAIGFSRSGNSTELLLANRILSGAGFTTLGISCTASGDLLAEVDHGLLIADGHEDGLVMLRSFTAMLIAAQWLFGGAEDRVILARLPDIGRTMLGHEVQYGSWRTRPLLTGSFSLAPGRLIRWHWNRRSRFRKWRLPHPRPITPWTIAMGLRPASQSLQSWSCSP